MIALGALVQDGAGGILLMIRVVTTVSRALGVVKGVISWDGIGGSDGRGVQFGHGGTLDSIVVGAHEGGRGHVCISWAVGTGAGSRGRRVLARCAANSDSNSFSWAAAATGDFGYEHS